MNYKQFKDEIREQLWPSGEQENLVTIHDGFFLQAMYDVQYFVPCLRENQETRFPHCATYFNCGMTVLPKPADYIISVHTEDRINPETGEEDADAELESCAKVFYSPVQFCHINRYVQLCERSGSLVEAVADAFSSLLFGVFRRKRLYPRPTDEGMAGLPKLPAGFHYPQTATDADGRSPGGVYAIKGKSVLVAPWIQSTETAVIISNGIKSVFNDADPVKNNPKLKQAIRLHVGHQHESAYGDPAKARDYYEQLWDKQLGVIEFLRVECLDQSRAHGCNEPSASMAQGMGGLESSNGYYNDARVEYTATCPAGKTGSSVKVVKDIGTVPSAFSVADANARANQQAMDEAKAQLVCVDIPVTYYSVAKVGHASCPGPQSDGTPAADGTEVNVPVPAGYSTSSVSQTAADDAAQTAADALAAAQLVCTYWNKAQTVTVSCPEGEVGDDVTKTQAAHTYSGPTQNVADGNAHAEATRLARLELVCDAAPVPVVLSAAQQVGPIVHTCYRSQPGAGGPIIVQFTVTVTLYVSQGYRSGASQEEANGAAYAAGYQHLQGLINSPGYCNSFPVSAGSSGINFTRTYSI